jgi:hypothetical protein
MSFSDAAAGAAWLQRKVKEAGIEVRITANGYEVAESLPDPAHIEAQLRARGIRDNRFIERAVVSANNAILGVEDLIKGIQGTLLPAPVSDSDETATESESDETATEPDPLEPFIPFVNQWEAMIPRGFLLQRSAATGSEPTTTSPTLDASSSTTSASGSDVSEPVSQLSPTSLLAMKATTSSGVVIEARFATEVSSTLATNLTPGYHAATFRSSLTVLRRIVFGRAPSLDRSRGWADGVVLIN